MSKNKILKESLNQYNNNKSNLKIGRALGKKSYKEEMIRVSILLPKSFYEKYILKDCKLRYRQDVLWEIIKKNYVK